MRKEHHKQKWMLFLGSPDGRHLTAGLRGFFPAYDSDDGHVPLAPKVACKDWNPLGVRGAGKLV